MFIIEKKDILILGKGPMQGIDDTTLTAEKLLLSLYYNGVNNFANNVEIYMFNTKDKIWKN